MTEPAIIKEADVKRILAGVRKAGFHPTRIRLKPGVMDILFGGEGKPADIDPNPWDEAPFA